MGVYRDQFLVPRNASGQPVDPYTGELHIQPEAVDIDLSGGLATGSGATAH